MKYYVRVCRPRFEVALIEVDANDERSALSAALQKGHLLPSQEWTLQDFDEGAYGVHVEQCLSEENLEADNPDDDIEQCRREARALEPDGDTRYLLLHADLSCGEGALVMQPWFPGKCPIMQIDLTGDWLDALRPIFRKCWKVRNPDEVNTARRMLPFRWPPWLPLIEEG